MTCTVEGCGRRAHARGLCSTHYTRWSRFGDPGPATSLLGRGFAPPEAVAAWDDRTFGALPGEPVRSREVRKEWLPAHVIERVHARIDTSSGPGGCWEWSAGRQPNGYGSISWRDGRLTRKFQAHRVAYAVLRGPVPEDMTIDHLCRNHPCCNPLHLRLVPHAVNARANGHSVKTHCPQGHPYDDENTRYNAGGRICRECHRTRERERHRRIRGSAA